MRTVLLVALMLANSVQAAILAPTVYDTIVVAGPPMPENQTAWQECEAISYEWCDVMAAPGRCRRELAKAFSACMMKADREYEGLTTPVPAFNPLREAAR